MVTAAQQHATFLAFLTRYEGLLRNNVVADKREFITACAGIYSDHAVPNFHHLVHDHQERLFATLKAHYAKTIPAFGALALSGIRGKQLKATAEDSLFYDLTQR